MLHKIYIQEINSRNNYARLKVPFRKTTIGQKSLTYIGPSVWNKLPNSMKRNISLNKFKYRISSRNNYARLKVPLRKTTMGQKSLSYIGPSVWNKLPSSIKRNISLNKFRQDVKKHYLRELRI